MGKAAVCVTFKKKLKYITCYINTKSLSQTNSKFKLKADLVVHIKLICGYVFAKPRPPGSPKEMLSSQVVCMSVWGYLFNYSSLDSYITSIHPSLQPHHVTRSSSLPRKRRGNTRTMLYSYRTVPREDSTSQSNATPPPATAGVCWWTLDGPYLGPPPGGKEFITHKHSMNILGLMVVMVLSP